MSTYAHFETSLGNFTAELFESKTPKTVANFTGLVEGTKEWKHPKTGQKHTSTPYYDGIVFHRVIKGFMIQGGDPLGEGHGGPGYQFEDEFHPELRHDRPGILSMANAGPEHQRQPVLRDARPDPAPRSPPLRLRRRHQGLDVVQKIGQTQTDRNDRPVTPVVMKKVTITRS